MKFMRHTLAALAAATLLAAAFMVDSPSQAEGRGWQAVNPGGVHYAVERNSLIPSRWRDELHHTADCMAPCRVDFDDRLSAVHLRYKWAQLNPAPGVYDFADLDAVFDDIAAAGKSATLVVMAGKYTPAWLFEAGVGHIETEARASDAFSQPLVPLPWDPGFIAAHGDLMRALSDHLRAAPHRWNTLIFVKNGGVVVHSGETRLMPPKAFIGEQKRIGTRADDLRDSLCEDWARAGYSEQKVVDASATMSRQIATAFPDQYIGLAFVSGSVRFPSVDAAGRCAYSAKNVTLNTIIKQMVADYGPRAILVNTVLTEDTGRPPIVRWIARSPAKLGFQLEAAEVGCRRETSDCERREFRRAMQAGIEAGAVLIEVHDGNINRYRDLLPAMNRALGGG